MHISIIAALSKNNVIGKDNKIPWHIPEDLKKFKELTLNHTVIMGRKTFDSIGKPLPKRRNIVITRNKDFLRNGVDVFYSLESAIEDCRNRKEEKIFIIGGSSLYKEALSFSDSMYLTIIDSDIDGDTFFPEFNKSEWIKVYHIKPDFSNKLDIKSSNYNYYFEYYVK